MSAQTVIRRPNPGFHFSPGTKLDVHLATEVVSGTLVKATPAAVVLEVRDSVYGDLRDTVLERCNVLYYRKSRI